MLICVTSLTPFTQVIKSQAALLLPFFHTSLSFLFFPSVLSLPACFPLFPHFHSPSAMPRSERRSSGTELRSSFACLCSFMETSSADGVQSSLPCRLWWCPCFRGAWTQKWTSQTQKPLNGYFPDKSSLQSGYCGQMRAMNNSSAAMQIRWEHSSPLGGSVTDTGGKIWSEGVVFFLHVETFNWKTRTFSSQCGVKGRI